MASTRDLERRERILDAASTVFAEKALRALGRRHRRPRRINKAMLYYTSATRPPSTARCCCATSAACAWPSTRPSPPAAPRGSGSRP